MTDKEKIRAEIEKMKWPKGNGDYWNGYYSALDDILSFIDAMPEEQLTRSATKLSDQEDPVSGDLEKEIQRFWHEKGAGIYEETARHFANWKREQMMKGGVRGTVDYPMIGYDFPNIYPNYRDLKNYCNNHGIKDNDKVKLIIVREG